jgi:hypothetical protein
MKRIKSLMPIILLSILLIAGMANAATLTPTGSCVSGQANKLSVALNVNDATGIIAFDITVTGTGLTATIADVSKTGSIAANWMLYNVTAPSTGVIRIVAAGGTGSGTTGAGNLGTITFTATDGTVNTEIASVVVTSASTTITPVAMTPVDCTPTGCSTWDDVIAKYNKYVAVPPTATWSDVIDCYNEYATS